MEWGIRVQGEHPVQNNKSLWIAATALAVSMCVMAPAQAAGWPFKKKKEDTAQQAQAEEGDKAQGDAETDASHKGQPAWMNAEGEVIDSSKVESGYGKTVKGRNDYEGEITGKPFPGAKFTQLEIGMPMKQVTDLVGQPNDQGAYVTGKAFIPFFFGGDKYRYEMAYKNQGRLVFAGDNMGTNGHLIWIIYNKTDSGYRE
jgi:hypothetical protein